MEDWECKLNIKALNPLTPFPDIWSNDPLPNAMFKQWPEVIFQGCSFILKCSFFLILL